MRNIVCIGGSTGALDAIQRIVRQLPADLPAAVFVVRHISSDSSGLLTNILQSISALPVIDAVQGAPITPGCITIAPPQFHLTLDRTHVHLANGPKENWARPAIDPLFRTAAQYHGPRAIGIVLSGMLDDGAAGLWSIKRRGGFAVVQDPDDADAADMPRHALAAVEVDVVADAEEIGSLLPRWCAESTDFSFRQLTDKMLEVENAALEKRPVFPQMLDGVGVRAAIVCPDCGGQLWQMNKGPLRYRCHVGHSQSAHSLLAEQNQEVENTGWQLLRAIEEDDHLCVQMLGQKLAPDDKAALTARLARNRERREGIRALLVSDPVNVGAMTSARSNGKAKEDGNGNGAPSLPEH